MHICEFLSFEGSTFQTWYHRSMEERQIIIARPWDCDGLDLFRDDPVGNPRENLLSEMKKTDRDLCICGNCSEMPTKEEQVCCGTFKGWKNHFKSGVHQVHFTLIMTSYAIGLSQYTANCWIRTEGAREISSGCKAKISYLWASTLKVFLKFSSCRIQWTSTNWYSLLLKWHKRSL